MQHRYSTPEGSTCAAPSYFQAHARASGEPGYLAMPQSGHHHFKTITQRNARQSAADPEHFAIPMDGDPAPAAAATRHINVWSMLRRSYRSALIFFLESVTSGAGGLRPGLPSLAGPNENGRKANPPKTKDLENSPLT